MALLAIPISVSGEAGRTNGNRATRSTQDDVFIAFQRRYRRARWGRLERVDVARDADDPLRRHRRQRR